MRTLDFETVLKDRLRLPDRPIAQQGIHTRVVDYKTPTGLSLLWVPQSIDNAPDTSLIAMSRTFRCRTSQGKGLRGVCTAATLGPTA
jgi:hypothetical protein